ncbi:uncharacterized protein LOC136077346 [Hydra vulgaris]|uniref:uncharacterized protein LOC136077346 n=1 Tax=Hydra vulgaris TaxID=6087 RepID=UPI0032EA36AD
MEVGKVFNSFNELKQAIEEYEKSSFISLYVRDSRTIELAIKKGLKRSINKELKYYYLTYCCYHGGRQFKSRSKGIRPNQSTYNIKCPFTICIGVTEDGEQFCVVKVINEHNHAIDKEIIERLPKVRKLSNEQEKDVRQMLKLHCNKWLVHEHIQNETGKKITLKDIHNLSSKEKGSTDVESLLAVFQNCDGADVDIKCDNSGSIQTIFFQDAEMKRFFSLYPELILMDATYKLTNLLMPLYILLAMGPSGESEIVAIFVTASEDALTLTEVLEIFKLKNLKWTEIVTIFTDKDMAERDSLRTTFPNAVLLLCLFHVLRAMSREVTVLKMGISESQRLYALRALQKMAYASSELQFEKLNCEFVEKMPDSVVSYFETNWNNCKTEWVFCWQQQNLTFGQRTTNRLESVNRRIKSVLNLLNPLPIFFKDLFSVIDVMRKERNHNFVIAGERISVNTVLDNDVIEEFSKILTPYALSFVRSQLREALELYPGGDNNNPTSEILGQEVSISELSCHCIFYKSMGLPCKHMFVARRIKQLPIFSFDGISI